MTEFMPRNDVIDIENVKESAYPTAAAVNPPGKKKKSGAFGIFRAALLVLRKRRGGEKGAKNVLAKQNSTASNNSNWTKLVGSMRPLRLQETADSPPADEIIGEIIPPASPTASSSCGTMSQYASATSLRDLDLDNSSDDEEDPDEVFDAITGDEMIDAKAEEFIAHFISHAG
ncbi:hypothetical protein DH2020_031199 [Rehmannia glutinosa]|uniref:Uncharacterized protein n=1 Tax=Rehmannia glutinosa TaxID=99300 RepID=A0ABR0VJE7_REHGL